MAGTVTTSDTPLPAGPPSGSEPPTDLRARLAAGWRRARRLRHSVRVRTTVAAVLVTATAVGLTSWLLVRSVEDTQLGQLRDDIDAELDTVSTQLAAGIEPDEAVQGSPSSPLVEVVDERDRVVAAGPTFVQDGREVSVRFRSDGAADAAYGTLVESGAPPSRQPSSPPPTRQGGAGGGDDGGPGGNTATGEQGAAAAEPPPSTTLPPPPPGNDGPPGSGGPEPRATPAAEDRFFGPMEMLSRTVETPSGTVTVSAAAPIEQVSRSVEALRGALVVWLPALVVLVGGIAWVLVGRALRPVEAIRSGVAGIGGTTTHRRVPEPPTGDEIGRLARTMNAMLGRLDRAATRQRQFVSDASHELRSPVATIRTRLEVARSNPARADWVRVTDAALAEEARLEALLDDLLLLAAHDETGVADPGNERVDVAAVALDEADRPRQVPVQVAGPTPRGEADDAGAQDSGHPEDRAAGAATVLGVPGPLTRVVGNLLDNACRHADSSVELRVARQGDTVRLTVDDDGPGVPATERTRVFERFARIDVGRARGEGGTGLGLAVVRSIVTGHHGAVRVETSALGGARFVVDLPAADDRNPTDQPSGRPPAPTPEHDVRLLS